MEGTDAGGDVRYLKGIYINVARFYVVIACTSGLEVKVVIGTGLDGQDGSDTHAWNKVKFGGGSGIWIPLGATWAASGDWFNPVDDPYPVV